MNEIDVNQELKIIENALRDIISFALNVKYGQDGVKIDFGHESVEML